MTHANLEALYQTARAAFPHQLEPTGDSEGSFEPSDGIIEYGEEFRFELCKMADGPIIAGGYLKLRHDTPSEAPNISITLMLAYHGNLEMGFLLSESFYLYGQYHLKTQTWDTFPVSI